MSARQHRELNIELLPIDSLQLDAVNARKHSPRQIRQIARSIETFGFNAPILADKDDRVIAGHGRALALKLLGWTSAPVIRLEHLTPAQAAAYAIADNRLAELAVWDDRLLAERLQELSAVDLNFSLEVTGFTMGEIDLRIEQIAPTVSAQRAPETTDEWPKITDTPPVSQRGDLWRLGKHRILCGNACEPASFRQLMGHSRAQAVFTDPPYNLPIDGHVSGKGRIRHREFAMASGEMDRDEYIQFLGSVIKNLARHSACGSLHYVCIDWRHVFELMLATEGHYGELKNMCVWVKDNAGMGSLYRSQHELVVVFKNGRKPHRNNVQLGQFGRNRTNVWQYPATSHFGRRGEDGDLLAGHPTPKPVALVADALLDCSVRGGLVLDPFLGSGSTLIAAERVGRVCRGIELDPVYVDLAVQRWQRFTGGHALHAVTGQRFDEIAKKREARHG